MKANTWMRGLVVVVLCGLPFAYADMHEKEMAEGKAGEVCDLVSANKLIGTNIVSRDTDESLGEVEDIVLDQNQRRIAYVVTGYGGILGMGEKYFAVPWNAFQMSGKEDLTLSLDVDPERLENAPGFDRSDWPQVANQDLARETHEFYEQEPYKMSEGQAWGERDSTWARRLSTLIGMSIENPENEEIAELDDVVIDAREGRAVYGIVSYGGVLGAFDSQAAVPFRALNIQPQREMLALNGDLADLKALNIETGDYSELEGDQFARKVHDQFAEQPYWIVYGYVSPVEQPSEQKSMSESKESKPDKSMKSESKEGEHKHEGMKSESKKKEGSEEY